MTPLLTIAIPTFNRCVFLRDSLESIVSQDVFVNSEKVEIVISNNCSTDETEDVCLEFVKRFPDKIHYSRLDEPFSGDENFAVVLSKSSGTFLKLHNDKLLFRPGALQKLVDVIEKNWDKPLFFCMNNCHSWEIPARDGLKTCTGLEELLLTVRFYSTWIGGLVMKAEEYRQISTPTRYSYLHFAQMDWMAEILNTERQSIVITDFLMFNHPKLLTPASYSYPEFFGRDLNTILRKFMESGTLSRIGYRKYLKYLLPFLNDETICRRYLWVRFDVLEYLKYVLPVYWTKPYFYVRFVQILFIYLHRKARLFFMLHPNVTPFRIIPALIRKMKGHS